MGSSTILLQPSAHTVFSVLFYDSFHTYLGNLCLGIGCEMTFHCNLHGTIKS
jgi:hypothetical protein